MEYIPKKHRLLAAAVGGSWGAEDLDPFCTFSTYVKLHLVGLSLPDSFHKAEMFAKPRELLWVLEPSQGSSFGAVTSPVIHTAEPATRSSTNPGVNMELHREHHHHLRRKSLDAPTSLSQLDLATCYVHHIWFQISQKSNHSVCPTTRGAFTHCMRASNTVSGGASPGTKGFADILKQRKMQPQGQTTVSMLDHQVNCTNDLNLLPLPTS